MMRRKLLGVWLGALLCISAVIGHAIHQYRWLYPHDDQMYSLAIAVRHLDPATYERASTELGNLVRERAESPWIVTRYEARDRYKNNYAANSYLTNALVQAKGSLSASSFAQNAAFASTLTPAMITGLAMIVVLVALLMARNLRLTAAVAVLGVIVVYEGLISFDLGDRLLPKRPGTAVDIFDVLNRSVRLFIDPGESTFLFGAAPRCAFNLLLLAVFLFRWQGRSAAGYWLFLPMTLLHQSQTGLFLAMVIALDLVLRPRELVKPGVLLAIGASLAVFFWRERLWMIIGPTGLVVIGTAAVLAIAAWFVVGRFSTPLFQRVNTAIARSRAWLAGLSLPAADAALLFAGWFGFLLLTAVGNYFASPEQSLFFWNHIAGRVLGTVRTEIVVALVYVGLGAVAAKLSKPSWELAGAAALTALLLLPAAWYWPFTIFPQVIDRNAATMAAFDAQRLPPGQKIGGDQEALIYYLLAKNVVTGTDQLQALR